MDKLQKIAIASAILLLMAMLITAHYWPEFRQAMDIYDVKNN
jgi:hypothetical protein